MAILCLSDSERVIQRNKVLVENIWATRMACSGSQPAVPTESWAYLLVMMVFP